MSVPPFRLAGEQCDTHCSGLLAWNLSSSLTAEPRVSFETALDDKELVYGFDGD